MSGRREPQVHEDARLIGQDSYIYEAGCAFVIERRDDAADRRPRAERGRARSTSRSRRAGSRSCSSSHFEGRLEYHAPWHTGRVLSHLFRGKVDVDEANRLLARARPRRPAAARQRRDRPHRWRGSRSPTPTTWSRRLVSKANAVAAHMRAPAATSRRSASRSATRSRTSRSPRRSGASSSSPTAPSATPGLREAIGGRDNVTVTEGAMGDGFYEAVVSTLAERAGRWPSAPAEYVLGDRRSTSIGRPEEGAALVARPRDRRRGGVPADHLLAEGGRAADHRRQHRPRDAALAADRARDDRAPREGRLRDPGRRQVARVHRPRATTTPRRSSAATG